MIKKTANRFLAGSLVLLGVAGEAKATVIYDEKFDGSSSTALNGTAPDVGANNWVAHSSWKADGSTSVQSSATLAFTPVDDTTYVLDARLTNNSTDNNWIGVGFANGQSSSNGTGFRFTASGGANVGGRGWTLFRPVEGVRNTFIGSNTGTGETWQTLTGDLGNTIDVRTILTDVIAGPGVDWQATFYAKLPASSTYTQIRAAVGDLNDDITSVGFANNGTPGVINSFQLSSVPEPTSIVFVAAGAGLMALRRRRSKPL